MNSLSVRNKILLESTVIPNYSVFQGDSKLRYVARTYPHLMAVPHIFELAIAEGSGTEFIDAYHQDLDNKKKSDIKILRLQQSSKNSWKATLHVGNPRQEKGGNVTKAGSLLVIISNTPMERADYFHIPKIAWKKLLNESGTISITYNSERNEYNKVEKYRLKTWKEFRKSVSD